MGIGRGQGIHEGWQREWLYWFDEQGKGNRFPTPEELAEQASIRAQQERQQRELAEQLLQRYRERFGELPE